MTYNDAPSGIYSSQVIDVVNYLNKEFNAGVKLISFISVRNFFLLRRKIKSELPTAIVLPMFPGVHNWMANRYLLQLLILLFKPKAIIGRSVIATHLAFKVKNSSVKNIVYDGRGAISAEWHEYKVITRPDMLQNIFELEKEAVIKADYRISVSSELIKYWQEVFNYKSNVHVVIPCTLNGMFERVSISEESVKDARLALNLDFSDLVFIYSGSTAGWQSFDLISQFIRKIIEDYPKSKMVFLSDIDENILQLQKTFQGKIICKKVNPNEVPNYLIAADYGLLTRTTSTTNQVASPVKFAEYLSCGLPVIISPKLGDYSEFVSDKKCGYLMDDFNIESIDKQFIKSVALDYFTKKSHKNSYESLIQFLK